MKKFLIVFLLITLAFLAGSAQQYPLKKVLVLVEGNYDLSSKATAMGRELAQLLGHFNTRVTIQGISDYKNQAIGQYDIVFYIGYSPENRPPLNLSRDLILSQKQVVWINSGFREFCRQTQADGKYGFTASTPEPKSEFTSVKTAAYQFSKGSSEINRVQVLDPRKAKVLAWAYDDRHTSVTPYLIKSSNLTFFADMPFLRVDANDRYLFFADQLHEILHEPHETVHKAMIRIEDVTPLEDPAALREVADILWKRRIPFLVGVVPIYVNPQENLRVSLSDQPELVDALRYMVQHGGSIVMHGATHQYKGHSTDDSEFWDAPNSRPIPGESREEFRMKIEMGIDEFVKNKLYPLAWETPHYMASMAFLEVISGYFSTAVEQRMVINDVYYGQYFPYIIQKDIYGQRIYPENLGYVPLKPDLRDSETAVEKLIQHTNGIKQVRDGIACAFFHPFMNPELLKTLVDGISANGFTFIDLKDQDHWVKTKNTVILHGKQSFSLNLDHSYLHEMYYDRNGKLLESKYSAEKLIGPVTKTPAIRKGETYVAEAIDYHIGEPSLKDRFVSGVNSAVRSLTGNPDWKEARVSILWNPAAKGADQNDQASLAAVFRSVNLNVDTMDITAAMNLGHCNLLIVPYSCAEKLSEEKISQIARFVNKGGNLITDRKNRLITRLGFSFSASQVKLQYIRDLYYPEEPIVWRTGQQAYKFDYKATDEIFCEDVISGLPVALGRETGSGKIIWFSTAFDPLTPHGYSYYPFALEYVWQYFQLQPVVKRENLEMYFDPGYRRNTSEEDLVKRWVKQGIRVIHVSAWHEYPKYTYDYAHLIRLAHANGILVYAWIEPPQVSQKFWNEHQEWREKNYLGQDIHATENLAASWRYPVALTDDNCRKAAFSSYISLLKRFDFDGVNLAELYFDARNGLDDPEVFTPMHPSARKEFRDKFGYDLNQIFMPGSGYYWKSNPRVKEQVTRYRVDKVAELHDALLAEISAFAKSRPGFNVIVTFLDTYFSPEITDFHGVSSDRMISLQQKYHFTLQAEDPQGKWSTDPDRYTEMGKFYSQKLRDPSRLMLDLNILNFREKEDTVPFPTLIQTGIESYQMVNEASLGAPRFTVYSESSCNPQDLQFFPYAASGQVHYSYRSDGLEVNSPFSFMLQLPPAISSISIDDALVRGYRDNTFIIPAGKHRIVTQGNMFSELSAYKMQPQIISFTGNLLSTGYEMQKLMFTYQGDERTLAALNLSPTSILLDGKDYSFKVLRGNDCYTVMLPSGRHSVEIRTGDGFSHGINLASIWSISTIAVYGILSVILIFILFIVLKFIRKSYEN